MMYRRAHKLVTSVIVTLVIVNLSETVMEKKITFMKM